MAMLCTIRGLYYMPIYGLSMANLPPDIVLSSPEQRMLEKVFMAEDSVPLNIALLGISPLIASSFIIQLFLNFPLFEAFPSPFRSLQNKKRMGSLTNVDIEHAAFITALVIGGITALKRGLEMKMFSSGSDFFVLACICDMMAALTVTHFCCDIIQHDGFGEGTGFLLLALTLSGFGKRLWQLIEASMSRAVSWWKILAIVGIYASILVVCSVFNETEVRIPLMDYSMNTTGRRLDDGKTDDSADRNGNTGPVSASRAPFFPLQISQSAVTAVFLSSGLVWFINSALQKFKSIQNPQFQIVLSASIAFLIALIPIGQTAENTVQYLTGLEIGVKGFIPGADTLRHLRRKMFHARLLGAILLFFIITACMTLDLVCERWTGSPLGSLNLLLLVSIISASFKTMEACVDGNNLKKTLNKERNVLRLMGH